jgi:methylmalonyl-CoA/ethylmalonyl-CoA epimerase
MKSPTVDPALEIKHHHFALSVPSIPESAAWYRDKLGFEYEYDFEEPAHNFKAAVLRRGNMRIELFEASDAGALPPQRRDPDLDIRTHGHKHVCFAVRDIKATHKALVERGVDIATVMDVAVYVRDNAGNLVEFFEHPASWS